MSKQKFLPANLGTWIEGFSQVTAEGNSTRIAEMFSDTCYWRDLLAFTSNIETLEGRDAIAAMLDSTLGQIKPCNWALFDPAKKDATEGFVTFETRMGRCNGYVRLSADGRCWTFLSSLHEWKGFEEPIGHRRSLGVEAPGQNWGDRRVAEKAEIGITRQPYVLIVGGGQSGLGLAARLKMLGVPTLVVDRHERPGDQWRSRYESLHLHDPVWYDHMPYLPFPSCWPVFAAKDKVGGWLESYADAMELNIWGSTVCQRASFDAEAEEWSVRVRRNHSEITLRPKHLVLATGLNGLPNVPAFPGTDVFTGSQRHSSEHPGGKQFRDRKVVVIGSNNSAHDICSDLWQHGADVTMIQRSSTHVIRQQWVLEALSPLYSEEAISRGMRTEMADLMGASMPFRMLPSVYRPLMEKVIQEDKGFYRQLSDVGFKYDFGDDGTGIAGKIPRRSSGYYIDTGASKLIANGSIKLRSGVTVSRLDATGVVLDDGSRLPADDIVYATGYGPLSEIVAKLISPEVAEKVGRIWGYGSGLDRDPGPWEGELRNMWKPTKQPGLWFHGGNFQTTRHFSLYLALQLKARMEKFPLNVFQQKKGGDQEVGK
jgi:putative flavoprotein involved in K+ transport